MNPDLERVTAAGYLADLPGRPIEEIRAMRSECQSIENALSYARRLIQGRLDIVGGELTRRRDGGAKGDLGDLVSRLPEILSEASRGSSSPGMARPPQDVPSASGVVADLESHLDRILPPSRLGTIADMTDAELHTLLDEVYDFEASVSHNRSTMHGLIDHLQAEITRRYKTGEANVDSLLG